METKIGNNYQWDIEEKNLCLTNLYDVIRDCKNGKVDMLNLEPSHLLIIANALNHYYLVGGKLDEILSLIQKGINDDRK